jgi:hypothetical protein
MTAVDWTQRARSFLKTSPPPTDETDERGVLSVLSVRAPLVSEKREAANEARVSERTTAPSVVPIEPSPAPSASRPYRLSPTAADRCHAGGWDDAEIEGYTARVTLFMRRGVNATDADDLAEALTLRDRNGDDRRLCLECVHLSGRDPGAWRCRSARAAGVLAELPGDLVTQCQHCPIYQEVTP